MFSFLIVLIVIASILLGFVVLIQNPKGGGFAAGIQSTQFMGVRQAADFLEKATWTLAIAILFLSMLTLAFKPQKVTEEHSRVKKYIEEANIQPTHVPEGIQPIQQQNNQ
ncbi:MAG: preprotein translocase subunit SecG [Bacteroidales bacterium]|nr:preprotein translocase subunit SecG [Bacteroidales bacterium]